MRTSVPARAGAIGMLLGTLALAALLVVGNLPGATEPGRGHFDAQSRGRASPPAGTAHPSGVRPAAVAPSRARPAARPRRAPSIRWGRSKAIGLPHAGRLVRGVRLPAEGVHYFTWDPILKRSPNRVWRRWGTDNLVRTTLRVVRDYAAAHPGAPRVGIGDLSRPHGGDFGPAFGGIGHATHQNGLDVDVYYPLRSGAERAPLSVDAVDLTLAQDLVDRFVRAGAVKVYVGPGTGLAGPPGVVQAIPNHDNHLHARLPG
jgi:penicillin-insensitive murein endopeptidase